MARQLRIEFEEVFYHITSRGNLRDRISFGDKDREKFLEILQRTKERYSYLLHAYIITVWCSFYGKTLKDLLKKGKNRSERQVAIYLSKVLSGKKNIEVGRYFGIKGSAVSETLKAVEQRMIEDEISERHS